MRDQDCVRFLKTMLPSLGLCWPGYRKVHRTLGKRLRRRLAELRLDDLDAYRAQLAADPDEHARLDALCRIPISRFWRDRAVFEALGAEVLGGLADACARRAARELRAWSCGCASGEEPTACRFSGGPRSSHGGPPSGSASSRPMPTATCWRAPGPAATRGAR
jgi:chemotaxis protein methyltransferase CheR